MLWRLDHSPPGDVAASGSYLAQVRTLSEGSVRPYGQGVFLRHRYIPLWATSKLVFESYCDPDMRLVWTTDKQLAVGCVVAEGTVVQFPPPAGITVIHDGGA